DAGEFLGVVHERVHELHVPGRVVETGALAVHLVRKAAGADDRDLQILGITLHRLAQRAAELEAAARTRDRELEHADLQRHDRARPLGIVRPEHREWRERAVIETLAWKYERSNSSATSPAAMCCASLGCPLMGGSARGPPPSSATGY